MCTVVGETAAGADAHESRKAAARASVVCFMA
jgi:hypothetical protein